MSENKRTNRRIVLLTTVMTIIIAGMLWLFSGPYEITEEPLWLPEESTLANEVVEGEYTIISEVSLSGTAVFVPIKDYKTGHFEDETVIVTQDKVYYLGKDEGLTYVSNIDLKGTALIHENTLGITGINEKGELLLKSYFERSSSVAILGLMGFLFSAIASIIIVFN